jgi:hypothetical protein
VASRSYRNLKFLYTLDFGENLLKNQRVYRDENNQDITPITPLFMNRVVDFPEKITGSSAKLRQLTAYIGTGQSTAKLPYAPHQSNLLKAHIEEILAVPRVICGDYLGERNITGGNNISL